MAGGIIGVFLLIWLVMAIGVGIDASINSSQSAFLWGLATLIGGIFAVLIYVLVGRDKPGRDTRNTRRTRSPGSAGQGDVSHVCKSCGETYTTNPSAEIDTCRNCGGIRVKRV